MTQKKITDKEAAERIANLKPFIFQHGARIEVRAIVKRNGILVTLSESGMAGESIAIIIPPEDVGRLTSWLRVYLAKVKGQINGKSKKEQGHGDSD